MENIASKRISTKKRKTEKHIAPPATAEEIRRGVGVTRRDRAIVRKVMIELGYWKNPVGPKNAPKLKSSKS